jgi:hypothetical protein
MRGVAAEGRAVCDIYAIVGKTKSFAAGFTRQCLEIEVAIRARRNIRVLTPSQIEVS